MYAATKQLEEAQARITALQQEVEPLKAAQSQPGDLQQHLWGSDDEHSSAQGTSPRTTSAATPSAPTHATHSITGAHYASMRRSSGAGASALAAEDLTAVSSRRSFTEWQMAARSQSQGGAEELQGLQAQLARTQAHAQRCEASQTASWNVVVVVVCGSVRA